MTLQQLAALIGLAAVPRSSVSAIEHVQRMPAGLWDELFAQQLITRDMSEQAVWFVSERGQAFVDHVCALPLPQQAIAWRMPTAEEPLVWSSKIAVPFEDEGRPPPPPKKPKRVIPTDPELLRLEAIRLMDAGYGMNEVKEQLELTEPQAQAFFFGK